MKKILIFFILSIISCQQNKSSITNISPTPDAGNPMLEVVSGLPGYFDSFESPKDSMIIANTGSGNLEWHYATDFPWLSFIPSSGINDDTILFKVNWDHFPWQGTFVGKIELLTNVDTLSWPIRAVKRNNDNQISLSYDIGLEAQDSNHISGYECYASFSGNVQRLETHYIASSIYQAEFQLSTAEQDSLLSAFNEIDFINLPNGIPNSGSGIYWPSASSFIRYRPDINSNITWVMVHHSQTSEKYPPGFLDFYDKITRILQGPNK
jgi:hypothetical protein